MVREAGEVIQFQAKTLWLFDQVNAIMAEYDGPLTLRQFFYRLVAAQVLPNSRSAYSGLSKHLTNARLAGIVDETRMVDRVRAPLRVPVWESLAEFLDAVRRSYRREKWTSQKTCVELWCEKDAVAAVLQPITDEYEITLFPCRGYDSYSALGEAADRIAARDAPTVILYLGDFDPSGVDMPRSIRDRLTVFGAQADLEVIALTPEQIAQYALPPNPTKKTDSRRKKLVAQHGNECVELDALPPDVSQALVKENVDRFFDLSAFEMERAEERRETLRLRELVERWTSRPKG